MTTHGPTDVPQDIDIEALREKYRQERDKRLRADGNDQYVEPKGRFATRAQGIAALNEVRDELVAWARATTADLRAHGLPHPVFGVFDGVQWILFAAAHTDNHLPQLRALQAHRELAPQGPAS